jgi:hypothetical protein
VYLWPRRQWGQAPLVLRRVVPGAGAKAVHLLTSVLDAAALPAEAAAELYALRWEAEVGLRSFKQTLERRALRNGTPEMAEAELTWAVLGLWLLGALTAAAVLGRGGDPLGWSAALARRAARRLLRRARGRWRGSWRRRCGTATSAAAASGPRIGRTRSGTSRRGCRKSRRRPRRWSNGRNDFSSPTPPNR